jgi:hypothetical protein
MSADKEKGYEAWKKKGRISLKTCDILGAIGIFIFGWLLWVAYDRAGKTGWIYFVPIIAFYVLGIRLHFAFGIVGVAIYIYAWYSIRKIIKGYQGRYSRELETPA